MSGNKQTVKAIVKLENFIMKNIARRWDESDNFDAGVRAFQIALIIRYFVGDGSI